MKSDRRHELQTNALALKLLGAPEFFRRYGTTIITTALVGQQGADPSVLQETFHDASGQLDAVMDASASNSQTAAEALSARGDLNWSMAIAASATTQPASSDQSPGDYVKAAEAAWNQVLSDYPNQELPDCSARFGLAAAAEDRGDWAQAGKMYQAIIDDPHAPPSLQGAARSLDSNLDRLALPLRIASSPASAPPIVPAGPPAPEAATQPSAAK